MVLTTLEYGYICFVLFLTTLEYGYICLVCYLLHWSTDTFVLYVTDYTGVRIHLSCMLLTTLENGYICLVYYWLHWSTDTFVLFCSWLHCSRDTCVLFCSWLHWSRDTFFLYVTDYSGIRIHLYYLLLTTLKYGYMCLVSYWLHWSTEYSDSQEL